MTASIEKAPVLGIDWMLGDDIGYQLGGLAYAQGAPAGRESVPAFPAGVRGVMRAIGWELNMDDQTITPILATTGA